MIKHIGTQLIKTKRLILRRFTVKDINDVYTKWSSSQDSDFWQKPHKSIEETKHEINEYIKNYSKNNWYMWAIDFRNELIGLVCGNELNDEFLRICIGYCLTKSYWNKGIATEASKTLIELLLI